MSASLKKFPRTPHLIWLGEGAPRDDKIMSDNETDAFLGSSVVVEEKIDGANLGLSLGTDGRIRAQSRGNFLAPGRSHAQWNPLWPWLAEREQSLIGGLRNNRMLFGEWCHATHTVAYDALPDWFVAFDVFEPETSTFWSSTRRNAFAAELGISIVPELFRGRLQLRTLPEMIGQSTFGAGRMEGLYLRRETEVRLLSRAKIVAREFKQQIAEHWTRRPLVKNRRAVATSFGR